jgi:hypothetical protein
MTDFNDMTLITSILRKVIKFNKVNKTIRDECGSHLHIELLLWKLYKDTLNFESESMEMYERLIQVLNNKKVTTNFAKKIS